MLKPLSIKHLTCRPRRSIPYLLNYLALTSAVSLNAAVSTVCVLSAACIAPSTRRSYEDSPGETFVSPGFSNDPLSQRSVISSLDGKYATTQAASILLFSDGRGSNTTVQELGLTGFSRS